MPPGRGMERLGSEHRLSIDDDWELAARVVLWDGRGGGAVCRVALERDGTVGCVLEDVGLPRLVGGVVPGRVGVSDEKTTMLPAFTGTATASGGSMQHWNPIGVSTWATVPRRCTPGSAHTQPFSTVASVSATQHVRYACGST